MLEPPAWAKKARRLGCLVDGSKGRGGASRRSGHTNPAIGPALAGDPFQRVVAVIGVIGVDPVLALGAVSAAAILIYGDIAMLDDCLPAPQDRAAHRLGGVRLPGVRMIKF